ncbi:MAG TPA: hypothetical protein VNU47_02210 [Candidatus Paceibacterota bacterium]|nr:hypothetical protein [Candidatus Paceibacterota bacterium]
MKRPLLIALITLFAAIGVVGYAGYDTVRTLNSYVVVEPSLSQEKPQEPSSSVRAYGEATLRLNETAVFEHVRITPLAVIEDSRCPANVQCIQAGTIRVRVETVSGMGTSTDVIALGNSLTTEAEEVAFMSATPQNIAGAAIAPGDYRLTFSVTKRVAAPVAKTCYVGGCSSELCSDRPDIVSNCLYKPEFACYRTARCEVQASGECGWTMTDALRMCLRGTSET